MSLINVTDLTFCYDGSYDNIFENASFQLDTDWKLGFTGRNGRGKTTFLRLLMGELPYRGAITASVSFEYFPYPVPDMNADTSEVIAAASNGAPEWMVLREINKLGIKDEALTRPFATLSNGERTKALLAALFLRENSFLLIDEPTNHLDTDGRAAVAEYLNGKRGFILVSHDRAFLDACCDHILSINRTNIDVQRGSFSSWYDNKLMRDAFEADENERLQKEIRKLRASAQQSQRWAEKAESAKLGAGAERGERMRNARAYMGEKSRRMQQRRKNLERRQENAISEKSGLLKNVEKTDSLKLHPLTHPSKRLIELDRVCVYYGDRAATDDVSLIIRPGDRTALAGPNGCGKSSILKLICGETIAHTGEVFRAGGLKISYVPQDTSHLTGSLDEYARSFGIDISLFKTILRKLDFARVQFEKPIDAYSAGQRKKVLIARSLCESAHLYIWDEPLNYVDVFSRMQIEELLQTSGATLLFVEHDRAFLDNIAAKTVRL